MTDVSRVTFTLSDEDVTDLVGRKKRGDGGGGGGGGIRWGGGGGG